jgi:hypothetical protein
MQVLLRVGDNITGTGTQEQVHQGRGLHLIHFIVQTIVRYRQQNQLRGLMKI